MTIENALSGNRPPSVDELLQLEVFQGLPLDQLEWLASKMLTYELSAGETGFVAGMPADYLIVIFEGEIRAERGDGLVYVARGGQVTGLLPYSRLTHFPSTSRAEVATRGAILQKDYFPEMLERMPDLRPRLVAVLSDRIRDSAVADQQHQKLASLGRLAAGLAHELNNPAAAARRATDTLRQSVAALRGAVREIEKQGLDRDARMFLAEVDCNWAKSVGPAKALDTLERSEREEELADWLDSHNVAGSWDLASALVDTGCDIALLNDVAARVPADMMTDVLRKLSASFAVTRLIEEIDSSTTRISEMVRAIKEYSYMDQSPSQEVDIHQGIENTLIMLKHKLKNGVDVERKYDETIPKLTVRGSELNQVWTNLIVNAVDAMKGHGKLRIETLLEARDARVDIVDDGPGVPDEIKGRIFEPFFTTKPIGQGTGLGLDAVYRIVRLHHGRIDLDSKPGETRFMVRIPLPDRDELTQNGVQSVTDQEAVAVN